ncbi:dethiobiotin synthase [Halomonas chromatireducens]|uniref:ATP-dependent dethiobiotin synthetase BioD n=1 Tax=Halomonas chromatireducens TaxID=507626 RepID=A0A0X8HBV1_9GAMM|nr:dethiobiotin synthase [Halomonas chromatireducens]AMC99614.1 ATP-dependent dethiobiotin synthetase BioD 1 [Halomonas chromatireducens]
MPAYFVTGTDTDAGKTLATAGLLALARRQGLTTLGLKPVASGCRRTSAGLRNDDALALQSRSEPAVPYAVVNPFAFAPAIAPHLAARRDGRVVTLTALESHVEPLLEGLQELILIEGAGGWRVPLNDSEDLSGLALRLELPVILVVGLKLGCISHARLTAEAIQADGLRLAGWIGNLLDAGFATDTTLYEENLDTLERTLPGPCLGILPRLDAVDEQIRPESAATCLVLPDDD